MIDAHVHLWRIGQNDCVWPGPDLPTIHRDFLLSDLLHVLDANDVDRAILVQSQPSEADTHWLLDVAASAPDRIAGVVGWVDLTATGAVAHIQHMMEAGPLLGLRPMMQDGPDDGYDDPALAVGLAYLEKRGLVLDALVRPRHLSSLLRLASRLPGLQIVIDHAAKPVVGDVLPPDWLVHMDKISRLPNVACKISGLLTELAPGAGPTSVIPVIDRLIHLFGPERLIWASDWPVMTLAAAYSDWTAITRKCISSEHWDAISRDNALRIYGVRS